MTGAALHFTYAAYLARQGMRMTDIVATVGRLGAPVSSELMRMSPTGRRHHAGEVIKPYPAVARAQG